MTESRRPLALLGLAFLLVLSSLVLLVCMLVFVMSFAVGMGTGVLGGP